MSEPETPPQAGPDTRLLETLNTNIIKLATRLEQTNLAEFIDLTRRPWKFMWTNFLGGLARGVGLFVGGGIMGALTLALLTWGIYHMLSVFNMIPFLRDISTVLTREANHFLQSHNLHK